MSETSEMDRTRLPRWIDLVAWRRGALKTAFSAVSFRLESEKFHSREGKSSSESKALFSPTIIRLDAASRTLSPRPLDEARRISSSALVAGRYLREHGLSVRLLQSKGSIGDGEEKREGWLMRIDAKHNMVVRV